MRRTRGFTIIELLVVISIIALLIAILLPSLAGARDRARFIKWAGYSHGLRPDSRMRTYFNFEQQSGTETNNAGNPKLLNRAAGDPFDHAKNSTEPEDWDGELGVAAGTPSTQPTWHTTGIETRWKGKGGLEFDRANSQHVAMGQYYGSTEVVKELTVFGWFRTANTARQILASHDRNEIYRFAIIDDTNDTPRFDTNANNNANDWGSTGLAASDAADDQWHLMAATYSVHTNTKKFYWDGDLNNTNTSAHNAAKPGLGNNGDKRFGFLGVGSEAPTFNGTPGPTSMYMDGFIDEFGLMHGVLDEGEVEAMYKAGKTRKRR